MSGDHNMHASGNQPSINDWSEYLLWAEKNLNDLEKKLLHKQYDMDEIRGHVTAINHALAQTLDWVVDAQQAKR